MPTEAGNPSECFSVASGSAQLHSALGDCHAMKTFTRIRTIAFLLRVVAISAILSGATFYLPEEWIDSFLVWCGLPEMPHVPIMRYVLLGSGHLQVGIGVVAWFIARDVVRYQPVVIAVLAVFLISAPAFYLTDAIAGLPWYWCLLDFGCCFLAGGVPLLFCLWPAKQSPNPQSGANGRQPFSSETNRTSGAAASRRSP